MPISASRMAAASVTGVAAGKSTKRSNALANSALMRLLSSGPYEIPKISKRPRSHLRLPSFKRRVETGTHSGGLVSIHGPDASCRGLVSDTTGISRSRLRSQRRSASYSHKLQSSKLHSPIANGAFAS